MSTKPITESDLYDAQHLIWRNLPSSPSTFGPCVNKCNSGMAGRGGGPCLACAEKKLAELVGAGYAARYVAVIKTLRLTEKEMLEILKDNED